MSLYTTPTKAEDWLEKLQSGGYRLTIPLRVLVHILANSPRALGAIDVYDLGRKEYPRLGLVTVYRTLEKLEALGLIQRVHQADGCHMYLRSADGHQHILLCTRCGQVEYFTGDDLNDLTAAVARQSGFEVQEHWLQLHGLCATCRRT
jgi:Fe2+ or Zn2+ uptake regulation protein